MVEQSVLMAFRERYDAEGRSYPAHVRQCLEQASPEHVSGISLAQLETPMMKQFKQAKDEVPDALLFFRMGDFYELFGLDAVIASDVCGLTLTSRDKNSTHPVPMAGVPVVSHQNTLRKCVQAGFKVAICEQVEDPKLTKTLVRREIVRVATPACPGELGLDEELSKSEGCNLVSFLGKKGNYTLGCADASIGKFILVADLSRESLEEEILSRRPKEILCGSEDYSWTVSFCKQKMNHLPRVSLHEVWISRSSRECEALFGSFFEGQPSEKFGLTAVANGLQVSASLLFYLKNTQRGVLRNVNSLEIESTKSHLFIDDATKKHLDFFQTSDGEKKGSLFWYLNRCSTHMGSRLLHRRLNAPLLNESEIKVWHESVEDFVAHQEVRSSLQECLRDFVDMDRVLARAAQGAVDPRTMGQLRDALKKIPQLWSLMANLRGQKLVADLELYRDEIGGLGDLLSASLEDDLPVALGKDARVVREHYNAELDGHYRLSLGLQAEIDLLEKKEREASGIATLKIGYTKVFGFYFEVSKGKLGQVPGHFIRKQTLTNGERYITEELKSLEERSQASAELKDTLEAQIFEGLREQILVHSRALSKSNALVAVVDLLCSFGLSSLEGNWSRPQVEAKPELELKGSVHPVLASSAGLQEEFVSNDVRMGGDRGFLFLLTGPNMAGKSTLMRQIAVTQVLMQIGCFVPARSARIGIADKIFTRIGSGDAALKGQSTFMVEMLETASILRNATSQSMIFMDEIGRGTSTYDGMSLAWAILEDLHDRISARTFFSTHYHELQGVAPSRKGIVPMQMQVVEIDRVDEEGNRKKEILFTRKMVQGSSENSFGLHVAQMAGVPEKLVQRAEQIMLNLNGFRSAEMFPRKVVSSESKRERSIRGAVSASDTSNQDKSDKIETIDRIDGTEKLHKIGNSDRSEKLEKADKPRKQTHPESDVYLDRLF